MPRGISEVKPKAITEISSRLRFLSYAILKAYASEDGKHLDYRNIHGSEEFARFAKIFKTLAMRYSEKSNGFVFVFFMH